MAKPRPQVLFLAIWTGSFAVYFLAAVSLGILEAPPETGDAPDYEGIAFNLWQHWRFGIDWANPQWRAPYLASQAWPAYEINPRVHFRPDITRPPAFPFLLALIYSVAGRHFIVWRIVNCGIMAGAVTIAAAVSFQSAGVLAAMLTMTIAALHPLFSFYSYTFMTEPLASLLVSLLAWIYLRNANTWTSSALARLGIVLALLVATRNIFIIWLPLALLPLKSWRSKVICLCWFLLVIGPWFIRNIVVTGELMPLGIQGMMESPKGFGPGAIAAQGLWTRNHVDPPIDGQNAVNFQVQLAKVRSVQTFQWARQHPFGVLYLMALHIWQEIRPHGAYFIPDWLFIAGLVAGIYFYFIGRPGTEIVTLIITMNLLSIALTWSANGRFMIPIHPLIVGLVSAGIVDVCNVTVARSRARVRQG